MIVKQENFDRYPKRSDCMYLPHVHLQAAVAVYRDNLTPRVCKIDADRARHRKTHGPEGTRGHERLGALGQQVLGGEHLVIADPRRKLHVVSHVP